MELIKLTPGANEQPINIKVQNVFFSSIQYCSQVDLEAVFFVWLS